MMMLLAKKATATFFSTAFLGLMSFSAVSQDGHPRDQPQAAGGVLPYRQDFKRVTHYRGLDAPPGQLASSLPSLKEKAAAGDVAAAAALYAGLAQCRGMLDQHASVYFSQRCEGVSDDDLAAAGKWLVAAAEGGNKDAQYIYAAAGVETIVGKRAGRAAADAA